MQIDPDHMGDADGLQEIGDHPPRDWVPAAVPLVRPRVAKVGHDRGDARGGRAPTGVGEQFDEIVVDLLTC
jgi:hypothetical protein